MTARDELTPEQRAALAEQLGDAAPATAGLLMSFGQSVRDRRDHDHSTQREDWYCLNLAAYMGERVAPVLRRLLDAEARVAELEAATYVAPSPSCTRCYGADAARFVANGGAAASCRVCGPSQVEQRPARVAELESGDAEREQVADEWTAGERLAAIVAQEINDAPAAELIKAATDDVLRAWAARIRDVGVAKGWSVWAAAFMDPDSDFVDTGMPSTETIVAELRRMDRLAILREVDERLAAMKVPEYLKGFSAGSYASAWQDCRARVASMVAGAGSEPRLPDHTVNEEEAPDSDGTPPAQQLMSHAQRWDHFARVIYERWNPGLRWADADPDDVIAYGADADVAMIAADAVAGAPCSPPTRTDVYREVADRLAMLATKSSCGWAKTAENKVREWAFPRPPEGESAAPEAEVGR